MDLRPGLDPAEALTIVAGFVDEYVSAAGADGVVVGLSGGLDSAVTAGVLARALGPDRVLGLLMPTATTPDEDMADARGWAGDLGLEHRTIPVDGIVDAAADACDAGDDRLLGNVAARARMIVLYLHANRRDRLVAGTGNKSELLTGYFTKHGDGGSDLLPLGDLYKTQVRRLGEHLDVPDAILDRPPSAGLWEGQTDEDELGLPYEELDQVLRGIELGYGAVAIARATDVPRDEVERIQRLERRTRHKRSTPMIPKLGARTSGVDWREKVV